MATILYVVVVYSKTYAMPVHGCSYAIDVNVDKVEDVLLHRRILN